VLNFLMRIAISMFGRKIVYFANSLGRARGDCRGLYVSCRGGEIEKHGWLK
jgi:hypothetical protein